MLIAAFFLHLTVLNFIKAYGSTPDLLLICVVFFGLFLGSNAGLESGIVAGILRDMLSLDYFGINTLILALTGFLAGVISANFSKESRLAQFLLVFFFTIFSMTFHYIIVSLFSKNLNFRFYEYFIYSVMPSSIYTGLVSIPVFARFINAYGLKELEFFL